MHLLLTACLLLQLILTVFTQTFPPIKLEILLPTGFRVAVPHRNGITQVTFNINIDRPLGDNNIGDFNAVVSEPFNGRWVLENLTADVFYSSKVYYLIEISFGSDNVEKGGMAIVSGAYMDISIDKEDSPANLTLPSGCRRSVTTVRGNPVCQGELVFEDDFDSLDWSKWNREIRIPLDVDDAEFVSFQRRSENFYVRQGQLHIVPSLLPDVPGFNDRSIFSGRLDLQQFCTGIVDIQKECSKTAMNAQILPPVVSARARTRHFFSFRYGTVEVRAKLPKGDWLFPLILLEPLENYYGLSGYASGQMRVAMIRGNEFLEDLQGTDISGKRVAGGAVLATDRRLRDTWLKSSLERSHLGNDFHIYTLKWTEDSISLEVDGNRYTVLQGGFSRRIRNMKPYTRHWENGNYMAPFDREFYLTLGVSAGGHSDFPDGSRSGPDRSEKPWENGDPKATLKFWNDRARWFKTWDGENAGLHVDYIRVYAL